MGLRTKRSAGAPIEGSRRFHPATVASGVAISGNRMPSTSFPSLSTCGTSTGKAPPTPSTSWREVISVRTTRADKVPADRSRSSVDNSPTSFESMAGADHAPTAEPANAATYADTSSIRNGILRSRFPVAAKIAFAIAGPVKPTAASPSPCGSAWLSTNHVSRMGGASGMRSTL